MKPVYKRVLLKISGEVLAGEKGTGYDYEIVRSVCSRIKELADSSVQVGIVVGGGNFWRGRSSGEMDRTKADHMGMLATVMNAIMLQDTLIQMGIDARVLTAVRTEPFAEYYMKDRAVRYLEEGKVCIFGAGTGNPLFSTDSGAALRAVEIGADVILKATNVDGVYDSDPAVNPDARRYGILPIDDVISQNLQAVDMTASILARDNKMPMRVFALQEENSIVKAASGDFNGTTIIV